MFSQLRSLPAFLAPLLLLSCGGNAPESADPRAPVLLASVRASEAKPVAAYTKMLQQIYVGYFGRPADPEGLTYFATQLQALNAPTTIAELRAAYNGNRGIAEIVDSFANSQESRDLYPGDNDAFITAIYRNLFNRAPDGPGKAYWAGELNKGVITRSNAVIQIMAGASSADKTIVENKTQAAVNFTASLTSREQVGAYSGMEANATVRSVMASVGLNTGPDAVKPALDAAVGQLAEKLPIAQRVQLAAMENTSAVVKTDGTVWSWGAFGGRGGAQTPTLLDGVKLVKLTAGSSVIGGLTASGDAWFWGQYLHTSGSTPAPSGYGGFRSLAVGRTIFGLGADGRLTGWGDNTMAQLLDSSGSGPVVVGTGYQAVAESDYTIYGLKSNGTLYTWGGSLVRVLNGYPFAPQYEASAIMTDVVSFTAGASHVLAIRKDGALWAWGKNNSGQLGDGTTGDRATAQRIGTGFTAMAAGNNFSLALKDDKTLWAWGVNTMGQLGIGTKDTYKTTPTLVGRDFVAVTAGYDHALGLKADGSIWAWGRNSYGQLGDGTKNDRFAPVEVFNASPSMCVAPKLAVNGVCQPPPEACTAPNTLQNGVCTPPPPVCVSPQVLVNGVCVAPAPPPATCLPTQHDVAGACVDNRSCPAGYSLDGNNCFPVTTSTLPRITQYGPMQGQGVGSFNPTRKIYFLFTPGNMPGRLAASTIRVRNGAGEYLQGDEVWDTANNAAFFVPRNPAQLVQGSYQVDIDLSKLTDRNNKPLTTNTQFGNQYFSWTMTLTAPITVTPIGENTRDDFYASHALFEQITVEFADTMNPATLDEKAVTVRDVTNARVLDGSYRVEGNVYTFVPSPGVSPSTHYTVTVNTSVRTAAGAAMTQPFTTDFWTPSVKSNTCPVGSIPSTNPNCNPLGTPSGPPTPVPPPAGGGTSTPGGTGTVGVPPGSGPSALQCLKFSYKPSPFKDQDAVVFTNTCNKEVQLYWCHTPSARAGTADSACGYGGNFFTFNIFLAPGESHDNFYSQPPNTTIWYGACLPAGTNTHANLKKTDQKGGYTCN